VATEKVLGAAGSESDPRTPATTRSGQPATTATTRRRRRTAIPPGQRLFRRYLAGLHGCRRGKRWTSSRALQPSTAIGRHWVDRVTRQRGRPGDLRHDCPNGVPRRSAAWARRCVVECWAGF